MKATEILNRCRDGAQEVQRLNQRLQRLLKSAVNPANLEADVAACQRELEQRSRALDAERLAACRIVDMLPDPACGILYRYFVSGQSQGDIVCALHITVGYYKRKKREGLAEAEKMDEKVVDALLPEWYGKTAPR